MKTRVRKWGNGLVVRIPNSFADKAGLRANSAVELSLTEGKLIVQPLDEPPSLEELLEAVTHDNLHGEWNTEAAMGREVW